METPTDEVKQQGVRYLQAWKALGIILRDGGSLSGYEKNCCFLNTQSNQFADVSSVVALDQASDSRAIAIVDWDHDGDLDLWCSNRTAPRVRYLQNNGSARSRYLAFRLRGVKCNRDAIGARIELETTFEGKTSKSIQTLRAGEGYLAQSSKWIHFGLGPADPVHITIRWPGGEEQTFSQLKPNSRYLVVEGRQPEKVDTERNVELAAVALPEPVVSSNLRVIPARRLPMPSLRFLDEQGEAFTLPEVEEAASPFVPRPSRKRLGDGEGNPESVSPTVLEQDGQNYTLLTIWATWCKPCIAELKEFDTHASDLAKRNIRWLPVNVDAFESDDLSMRIQLAKDLLSQIDASTPTVLATRSAVECLDVVQRVLVTKQDALPVPSSFLLDRSGYLMAVYKGTVTVDQVVRDVHHLERPTADPRDPAIPLAGRWSMDSFPPDLMAIPAELTNVGRTQEALEYLVKHVPTKDFKPPITADQVARAYLDIGRELVQQDRAQDAELALQQALRVDETNVPARMALGEIYSRQRRTGQAVQQYRAVLEVAPQQPLSLNNLAWLLSTTPDEKLRRPTEAVALAERLCEQANYGDHASLDTLSAALAADGQFELATDNLEQAIRIAKEMGRTTARMEARLRLFRSGKPYIEH